MVLACTPPYAGVNPPNPKDNNKAARGWNNIATGWQLCPRKQIEVYARDPKKYVP